MLVRGGVVNRSDQPGYRYACGGVPAIVSRNDAARSITIPLPEAHVLRGLVLKGLGILLLLAVCYLVRQIWLPLGLAFILAMVLDPVVDRMEGRGWSRMWATSFIYGSFLAIAIGLSILAYPHIVSQFDTLQAGFQKYFPDTSHKGLFDSFQKMGFTRSASQAGVAIIENARATAMHSSGWITGYGISLMSNGIWVIIVPIISFYALRDFHLILAKMLLLVPRKKRDLVQTGVAEITAVFGKYLRGLAIVSLLNGIATTILLGTIGVPGWLLLGIAAGLLYSVPYIGALLTILLTAVISFGGGGPQMMFLAVGCSIILHQVIFDLVVSPRILGGHVGLHPILSIVALLVGNVLLGIVGMILAVPLAACIQVAVLALVPKLSQEIEFQSPVAHEESVDALVEQTKEEHQKIDATSEMHAAVSAAVESIEREAEAAT
jgi:predicted PurR-regulated permease PerM